MYCTTSTWMTRAIRNSTVVEMERTKCGNIISLCEPSLETADSGVRALSCINLTCGDNVSATVKCQKKKRERKNCVARRVSRERVLPYLDEVVGSSVAMRLRATVIYGIMVESTRHAKSVIDRLCDTDGAPEKSVSAMSDIPQRGGTLWDKELSGRSRKLI